MKFYHVSPEPQLTVLHPAIPRTGTEGLTYEGCDPSVFLCPEKNIQYWQERLTEDHGVAHPYVYEVDLDIETMDVFCGVEKREGHYWPVAETKWTGEINWAYNEVWTKQEIVCKKIK